MSEQKKSPEDLQRDLLKAHEPKLSGQAAFGIGFLLALGFVLVLFLALIVGGLKPVLRFLSIILG